MLRPFVTFPRTNFEFHNPILFLVANQEKLPSNVFLENWMVCDFKMNAGVVPMMNWCKLKFCGCNRLDFSSYIFNSSNIVLIWKLDVYQDNSFKFSHFLHVTSFGTNALQSLPIVSKMILSFFPLYLPKKIIFSCANIQLYPA